ncbi:MAG: helix-turn-helix domain-containing protein [Phycisphaerae bacterium]|nr:helix-turn-helix domain-containing protein [Phycisphaerae bacterium]
MAKLFYTLEEAAAKLKRSEADVKQLVAGGQLQEFRDRDRLMFKVDQVDLLAGGGEEEAVIPLAESGEMGAISLASDSGTGMNLESPKEQTGISIFEADQTEEADPSAVTQVTEAAPDLAMEGSAGGSGLLDMAREADDTSLGKDLLPEGGTEGGAAETTAEGGGLFEATPVEAEATAGAGMAMMVAAEPYDGTWSGIAGGMALGIIALGALVLAITIFGLAQAGGAELMKMISGNYMMWVGIAAGVVLLPGLIGMVIGRKT